MELSLGGGMWRLVMILAAYSCRDMTLQRYRSRNEEDLTMPVTLFLCSWRL